MILALAWRNLWRNKFRTLITIMGIIIGIWAANTAMSISYGLNEPRIENAIQFGTGDIQVHSNNFRQSFSLKDSIPEIQSVFSEIRTMEGVGNLEVRTRSIGLISTLTNGVGTELVGIQDMNANVLEIPKLITDGEWLSEKDKNPIILGQSLAERLKVKVGTKVVVHFQGPDEQLIAGAFKIKGIYTSPFPGQEISQVFLLSRDLESIHSNGSIGRQEIIIRNEGTDQNLIQNIQNAFPNLTVTGWKEAAPEMGYTAMALEQGMFGFIILMVLALGFGLANSGLMALLERKNELSMLRNMGMDRIQRMRMILTEQMLIILFALPVGLLLSWLTISILGITGLDFTAAALGFKAFGMPSYVYPRLAPRVYGILSIFVILISLASSLFIGFWTTRKAFMPQKGIHG